jgi:hypothetical protein
VWIRFVSNRAPFAAGLDGLLARDEVAGHEFVFGELLIGDRGGRQELLASYELMDRAPVVSHGDVMAFVRGRSYTAAVSAGSTPTCWPRHLSGACGSGRRIHHWHPLPRNWESPTASADLVCVTTSAQSKTMAQLRQAASSGECRTEATTAMSPPQRRCQ